MKPAFFAIPVALCWACGGPTNTGQGVKTPEELVAEQEQMADQQAKESDEHKAYVEPEKTDLEKKAAFDKRQADLEMKRAARGAETCPGTVTEESPPGTAKVTVTFGNDGHVKSSTISSPYDEKDIGKCVLKAMNSVIVPRFDGPEETMEWEVKLEPPPPPEKKDDKKGGKKK